MTEWTVAIAINNETSIKFGPNNMNQKNEVEKLLLTRREAAEVMSVSEKTVQRMEKRGELPVVMIRSMKRYSTDSIRQLIAAQELFCSA
jgi:excisionase family DNA binding protein